MFCSELLDWSFRSPLSAATSADQTDASRYGRITILILVSAIEKKDHHHASMFPHERKRGLGYANYTDPWDEERARAVLKVSSSRRMTAACRCPFKFHKVFARAIENSCMHIKDVGGVWR